MYQGRELYRAAGRLPSLPKPCKCKVWQALKLKNLIKCMCFLCFLHLRSEKHQKMYVFSVFSYHQKQKTLETVCVFCVFCVLGGPSTLGNDTLERKVAAPYIYNDSVRRVDGPPKHRKHRKHIQFLRLFAFGEQKTQKTHTFSNVFRF